MKKSVFVLAASLALFHLSATAATIIYSVGTVANDASGSSVFNGDGTYTDFVMAMRLNSGTNATVNSVTFAGTTLTGSGATLAASHTGGGVTSAITMSGTNTSGATTSSGGAGYTNSTLSDVLKLGFVSGNVNTSTESYILLTLSGLSVGMQYHLQTFHLQQGQSDRDTFVQNDSNLTNATSGFNAGGGTPPNNLAASVIYTWTADATSQAFRIAPVDDATTDRSVLNAAALYVVPEPATVGLLGFGALVTLIFRRRPR